MTKLLIVLIVVLAVVAIAQLAKVYEITARLRGKREEEVSLADNRMNSKLMLLFMIAFFGFFVWLLYEYYGSLLPPSASAHGVLIDELFNFNWIIVIAVFIVTNFLLFYFAFRYYDKPGAKAYYFPHDNRLEMIWTVIPAVVLAVVIIWGLRTWNDITAPSSPDAIVIEFYSKQFDWTARYPGPDGKLGPTDFRLINGTNPLGILTRATVVVRLSEMQDEVHEMEKVLEEKGNSTPGSAVNELHDRIDRLNRHRQRLLELKNRMEKNISELGDASAYLAGEDDIVTKDSHMPVRKEVKMVFRSQDVIHSAYLPHFRAQMNTVPGMSTTFKMVPIITTDSMRLITEDPEFNYILLCNKICGASHYNMQMDILVESEDDYNTWLGEQKAFIASDDSNAEPNSTLEVAPEQGITENTATEDKEVAEVAEEQE